MKKKTMIIHEVAQLMGITSVMCDYWSEQRCRQRCCPLYEIVEV